MEMLLSLAVTLVAALVMTVVGAAIASKFVSGLAVGVIAFGAGSFTAALCFYLFDV
jgi:uncharacterized protein involved in cysteine biosynthesis